MTPTVLAMMGLNVPDDMEGGVLTQLFETPIEVQHQEETRATAKSPDQAVYTTDEEEILTQRLMDLGYLE